MRTPSLLLVSAAMLLTPAGLHAQRADSLFLNITDVGNIRLVISNAGTFGNRFGSRSNVAMEWPAHSGIDHLVRGGLWVGAINGATGDTLVSMGARDAYYQDPITDQSEFSPITPAPPEEFSNLPASPSFDPRAISHEDLHTVYVDTLRIVKRGAGLEPHTPMGIRVVQNTYSWSFDPVDDFVVSEFNIINVAENTLQDVWIGIYTELVTNNRNWFPRWPPGGAWFDFQLLEWDGERRLLSNHNVRGADTGAVQWGGLKILGSGGHGATGRGPDSISTMRVSLEAWSWTPSRFLVWSDDSLYAFMSKGTTDFPPGIPDPTNTEINPVSVVSVGPFTSLAPGDTAQVVFAFVGGQDRADLERNASWAQRLYDERYDVRPTAVEVEELSAVGTDGRARLRWRLSAEAQRSLLGVRVQRAGAASGPYDERTSKLLAPTTEMSFEDLDVEHGLDYWYRLALVSKTGAVRTAGPVSVRLISGLPTRTALHQPFESATGGPIQIRYSISHRNVLVRLAVHDARGRLVWSKSGTASEAGEHSSAWDRLGNDGVRTPRGIYFVNLRAGRLAASRKLVLLRD